MTDAPTSDTLHAVDITQSIARTGNPRRAATRACLNDTIALARAVVALDEISRASADWIVAREAMLAAGCEGDAAAEHRHDDAQMRLFSALLGHLVQHKYLTLTDQEAADGQ